MNLGMAEKDGLRPSGLAARQQVLDQLTKIVHAPGFGQERGATRQDGEVLVDVAGDDDEGHRGPAGRGQLRKGQPIQHPWHVHVGDDQLGIAAAGIHVRQGVIAGSHSHDVQALFGEDFGQQLALPWIILQDKNLSLYIKASWLHGRSDIVRVRGSPQTSLTVA